MKQGLTYISERDSFWVYSDIDTNKQAVNPLSMYVPLVKIKRGQPVSIALPEDISEAEKALGLATDTLMSKNCSYITLTNTSRHTHSVGLAVEYSEGVTVANQDPDAIHIVGQGHFRVNPNYEYATGYDWDSIKEQNYIPDFLSSYKANIGKTVYVKSYDASVTADQSSTQAGLLTVVPEEAYLAYNNIIQIGHVADAWSTEQGSRLEGVCIEVQIEGDARGPVDATQFEADLGETVYIGEDKPVKVFALGEEENTKFSFTIGYKGRYQTPHKGFIAIQRQDGKTYVIWLNTKNVDDLSEEDRAFINLGQYYNKGEFTQAELGISSSSIDPEEVKSIFKKVSDELQKAIKAVAYSDPGDLVRLDGINGSYTAIDHFDIADNSSDKLIQSGARVATFTADQFGGYYTLYISKEAEAFFPLVTYGEHGSYYNKGYAVLADLRSEHRQNILGVYLGSKTKLLKNEKAVFMREGLFTSKTDAFSAGATYYLSSNGNISTIPDRWFDSIVKAGYAQDRRRLVVSLSDPRLTPNGELPVGYMKPCVGGYPEFGFVKADGQKYYAIEDYKDLYDCLLQFYNEDDLSIDKNHKFYTDDTKTDYVTKAAFKVPVVYYDYADSHDDGSGSADENGTLHPPIAGKAYAQIKYLKDNIYHPEIKREAYVRSHGNIPEDESAASGQKRAKIPSVDVSKLVSYGPFGGNIVTPDLEYFDVKLFVDLRDGSENDNTSRVWTEVRPGFHEWNNTEYFGFEWKLEQTKSVDVQEPFGEWTLKAVNALDDANALEANVLGPCVQKTPFSPPESIVGKPYKLIVIRRELFARQFDVGSLFESFVKNSITDFNGEPYENNAVSAKAIRDDIKTKVKTSHLDLDNAKLTGTVASTDIVLDDDSDEASLKNRIKGCLKLVDKDEKWSVDFIDGMLRYASANYGNIDDAAASETLSQQIKTLIKSNRWNMIPYAVLLDHINDESSASNAVHGLRNGGTNGNLNARQLQGIQVGQPGATFQSDAAESATYNVGNTASDTSASFIIPYLKLLSDKHTYETNIGTTVNYKDTYDNRLNLRATESIDTEGNRGYKVNSIGSNRVHTETIYTTINGESQTFKIEFDYLNNQIRYLLNDTPTNIVSLDNTSTIKVKNIYKELLEDEIGYKPLSDYNDPESHDFTSEKSSLQRSALQAASLIPTALFQYKNQAGENLKKFFGIIIERIAETKDKLNGTADITGKIGFVDETFKGLPAGYSDIIEEYAKYTYNDEEKKSIVAYLEALTNNGENSVNVLSSIGLLLEAAKETQKRLLGLELSTYGKDSPTKPGNTATVQNAAPVYATPTPTFFGLNRLVKALCAEVFLEADPKKLVESLETAGSLSNYSRLDDVNDAIHGTRAANQIDSNEEDYRITLAKSLGATYPVASDIAVKAYAASSITEDNILRYYDVSREEDGYRYYTLKSGYTSQYSQLRVRI